jgi:thiosulfate dehydrogenase
MKIFVTCVIVAAAIGIGITYWAHVSKSHSKFELATEPQGPYYYVAEEGNRTIPFNLHDPSSAPPEYRDRVLLGYHIMLNSKEYAPDYVSNRLSCVNCHFCAGNTTGGRNGSISLVGVTTRYPQYSSRDGRDITLADRIQNCFMRSMNGKRLPVDGPEMTGVLAYLHWISQDVKHFKQLPWLGLRELNSSHKPDAVEGAKVYVDKCQICHGEDGNGSEQAPPLWGNDSFNDGAGMNTMPRLSSFVYDNMPYQEPSLTIEQALDVAAFVISKPRPRFVPSPPKR